jgi:hypothetical protein
MRHDDPIRGLAQRFAISFARILPTEKMHEFQRLTRATFSRRPAKTTGYRQFLPVAAAYPTLTAD